MSGIVRRSFPRTWESIAMRGSPVLATLTVLVATATFGVAAPMAPIEMVRTAYDNVAKDKWLGKNDPADVTNAPKKLTAEWFTPRFITAMRKNAKCWADGRSGPVSSVWFDGQDQGIADVKVEQGDSSNAKQTIKTTFRNIDKTEKRDFNFNKAGASAWLIDDVVANGASLHAVMTKGCVR